MMSLTRRHSGGESAPETDTTVPDYVEAQRRWNPTSELTGQTRLAGDHSATQPDIGR